MTVQPRVKKRLNDFSFTIQIFFILTQYASPIIDDGILKMASKHGVAYG